MSIPIAITHYHFVTSFEIGDYMSSNIFLLFQDCFGYSGFLSHLYEFSIKFLFLWGKKAIGIFKVKSVDQFGK